MCSSNISYLFMQVKELPYIKEAEPQEQLLNSSHFSDSDFVRSSNGRGGKTKPGMTQEMKWYYQTFFLSTKRCKNILTAVVLGNCNVVSTGSCELFSYIFSCTGLYNTRYWGRRLWVMDLYVPVVLKHKCTLWKIFQQVGWSITDTCTCMNYPQGTAKYSCGIYSFPPPLPHTHTYSAFAVCVIPL